MLADGFTQVGLSTNISISSPQNICPTCVALKFRLAQAAPSTMHAQCHVTLANLLNLRGTDRYYHMWVLCI